MNTTTEIVLIVVLVIVAVIALALFARSRKTSGLRHKFGPEYEKAVEDNSGQRQAEAELLERQRRVAAFQIKPLGLGDRTRYNASWQTIQGEFVDNPERAVSHADELLGDVMAARGYPVTDFEQQSADLSVDHPIVVQNYRAAHDIALKHGRGEASTEDLRQAMIHFRSLFDELVSEPDTIQAKAS